jgi:hypothetical protein
MTVQYCTGLGSQLSHVLPLITGIFYNTNTSTSRFFTKQDFVPAKSRLEGGTKNLSCVKGFWFSLFCSHECQDNTLKQVKTASFHISAHIPSFNWFQNVTITAPKITQKYLPLHIPHTLSTTLTF